jgi:hypothetical protein
MDVTAGIDLTQLASVLDDPREERRVDALLQERVVVHKHRRAFLAREVRGQVIAQELEHQARLEPQERTQLRRREQLGDLQRGARVDKQPSALRQPLEAVA